MLNEEIIIAALKRFHGAGANVELDSKEYVTEKAEFVHYSVESDNCVAVAYASGDVFIPVDAGSRNLQAMTVADIKDVTWMTVDAELAVVSNGLPRLSSL